MTASGPVTGQVLGHCRILERIGAGGMGVVYRAHDERLDRDVALKVLSADMLSFEAACKRFRKEALALSRLGHPNIATIFDFDTQVSTMFSSLGESGVDTSRPRRAKAPLAPW